jgi:Helix-turn-helix domain
MNVTMQLDGLDEVVRNAVAEALAARESNPVGWLDVEGAATHLATTPAAIRSLAQKRKIPFTKAPNGRLLFNRDELDDWVVS